VEGRRFSFPCRVLVVSGGPGQPTDRLSTHLRRHHRTQAIRIEHERAERLLLNVLPAKIAAQLKAQPGKTIAEEFTQITALFADVVGFTPISAHLSPTEAVELLNELFTAFDRIAARYGVEKVKTMGDGYMVVAGAPVPRDDDCDAIAGMAIEMRDWVNSRTADDGIKLQVAGRIQVARPAYERLSANYVLEPRGLVNIKGKGELETWFLEQRK